VSALQSQLARLDAIINRRVGEEEAAQVRADADLESARRAKMRENAEACRQIQAVYSDAFRAFNAEVPMAIDGETPLAFRKRLFSRIVRRLPEANEWARTRADDIPLGPAMDTIEALVLTSARQEGLKPSYENLPSDGSLVAHHRTDSATGERMTECFGRRSFIADMGRPGRRVAAIIDRNSGQAIWGRPLPAAR
jgi:hypothetical protein